MSRKVNQTVDQKGAFWLGLLGVFSSSAKGRGAKGRYNGRVFSFPCGKATVIEETDEKLICGLFSFSPRENTHKNVATEPKCIARFVSPKMSDGCIFCILPSEGKKKLE